MQDAVGIIWQLIYFTFFGFVNCKHMIFGCVKRSVFQRFVQGKNVGFPVLVVHLHSIRMQLSLAGFFVRKFQVVNRNDLFKKVAYSFHCLCLNIRILRACTLPKPFNIFYFLPPGFLSRFIIHLLDDWHGFRLAIPFTSNAENRYSHSHSWACYSYSHTRTPHSHHYSHYR